MLILSHLELCVHKPCVVRYHCELTKMIWGLSRDIFRVLITEFALSSVLGNPFENASKRQYLSCSFFFFQILHYLQILIFLDIIRYYNIGVSLTKQSPFIPCLPNMEPQCQLGASLPFPPFVLFQSQPHINQGALLSSATGFHKKSPQHKDFWINVDFTNNFGVEKIYCTICYFVGALPPGQELISLYLIFLQHDDLFFALKTLMALYDDVPNTY